jgi:glycerol-3-phosphate dehydrogenase
MAKQTDVVVIGGGCTGTGIARDLVLRGMRVILVEQADLAHGATGHFHGLLHSGGRYVVSDPISARECIAENRILRHIAPACIEETGGYFVVTGSDDPAYEERFLAGCQTAGIAVEEVSPSEAQRQEPYLTSRLHRVFVVPDGAIDGFDLVRANARAVTEGGGEVWTHRKVTAILTESGRVCGVCVRDVFSDEENEIRCEYVVNAGGAWAGQIAGLAGIHLDMILSKGSMIIINHRWTNRVLNRCHYPSDGDILVPAKQVCILGTTAITVSDPDRICVEPHEVAELLDAGNILIESLSSARLSRAYAGIRPLYQERKIAHADSTRDVSRGYFVIDHESRDGVANLISVVGGKLTTYRRMAEEAVDLICQKAGLVCSCRTAEVPLPGSEGWADARKVAEEYGLPVYTAQRLVQRHGPNVHSVLAEVKATPQYKSHICICEPVIEAEIRYCVRQQWVRTLNDLRKRTRLGTGPCQGTGCTLKAAVILADALGQDLNYARRQVDEFLQERWMGRRPVLGGVQLAQEELLRAYYQCLGGFGSAPETGGFHDRG